MPAISSEEAYAQLFDAFMALQENDIKYCNMPSEVATAEAWELAEAAMQDRASILSLNVNPEYVDTLAMRAAAFTHAVAQYDATIAGDPEAEARLKALIPKGYKLQKYLDK
ncbi:MAG: hypothetical protein JXR76_30860, partial [Deltaproteobacteria bacterium]|nr:hypothetical protein [Deltaproteobacteria bacterium]